MFWRHLKASNYDVVPHAGTWIEIHKPDIYCNVGGSFPTRERGLKFELENDLVVDSGRSPRGNVD